MARQLNKLSATKVKMEKSKGWYHDGGGLYLQVSETGAKSWVFCYMLNKRERQMGFGEANTVSLAEARLKMAECRKLLVDKIDPIDARKAVRNKARQDEANKITFEECAKAYIDAHIKSWRNTAHINQWPGFFKNHVYPTIGNTAVSDINIELVLKVLEPLWNTKTVTGKRVRQRIEKVLDWAKVRGYRHGENPARWRGNLDHLLAPPSKIWKVKHFNALPHVEVGEFVQTLRKQPGLDGCALEFAILTATRTSETLGAKWSEMDFQNKVWVIPAERMKSGKEHRIPLSDQIIAVMERAKKLTKYTTWIDGTWKQAESEFIFSGRKRIKPLSNMTMLALLRRMERQDITVHGFRSTFRDWVAERTNFPREVAEAALAHAVENKVEAAYFRSDLFDKRRKLMEAWGKYCDTPSVKQDGVVVSLADARRV